MYNFPYPPPRLFGTLPFTVLKKHYPMKVIQPPPSYLAVKSNVNNLNGDNTKLLV